MATMASKRLLALLAFALLVSRALCDTDPLDCDADDDVVESPAKGSFTCSPQDREALLQFKASITSDPNHVLSSWQPQSFNCCSWHGVTCDGGSGRVAGLKLQQSHLHGSLSPALGNLSFLQVLTLYENSFAGTLPSSLGNLARLTKLCLSNTGFSGSIPQSFGGMTSLQMMDVSYNKLSGPLPSSIGNMKSLQHIRIYNNNIDGPIPTSFGTLSNLFNADLALNKLSGQVPDSFNNNLTSLAFLFLDNNQITGFPKDLSNMKRLQWVTLNNNPSLTVASLAGLVTAPMLAELEVSNCGLSGPFPSWISKFPHANMDLLSDEVTPALDLSSNAFTGPIPSNIGSFLPDYIQSLSLNNNRFSAAIPPSLANLTSLRFLSLQLNQLTGTIPSSFSALQSLSTFNVSFNKLSGQIPQVSPFTTFDVSAYQGNLGLCGTPLPACK